MVIAPLVFMMSTTSISAPIQRGERIKPVEVSGQPRQVTGSYFRMNDLDFVARVADRKDEKSKGVFNSVVGKELANRIGDIVVSRKSTMGVPRLAPIKIGSPNGTPNGKQEKPKPIKIGGNITVNLEIPPIAQSNDKMIFATTRYYGESNFSTGNLTVNDVKGTPIDAISVTTYTGEVKDGESVLDKFKTTNSSGDGVPLKTNQSYSVLLKLEAKKQGDFKEDIVLEEGGRKVTLRVTGRVLPPAAQFSVGGVQGDFNITPGKPVLGSISIQNTGSKAISVSASSMSQSNIKISGASQSIPAGAVGNLPITVFAPVTAADGDFNVSVAVSGPGAGVAPTYTTIPVKVSTVWTVWEGIKVSGSKSTINATFRYSNSGYWDLTSISQDSSTLYGDAMALAVWINLPNGQNKKFGTWVGCYAGAGNTSVDTEFGQDPELAKIGDKFISAPCKARGIFEGQFSGSTYVEDQLKYWKKEQNIQPLLGTVGGYVGV